MSHGKAHHPWKSRTEASAAAAWCSIRQFNASNKTELSVTAYCERTGRPADFQALKLPALSALKPSFTRIAAACPERLPERQ